MSKTEPIVRRDINGGHIYLREAIIVAFFLRPPIGDIVEPLTAAFDSFLAMVPEGTFRWESIGSSSEEWKPVNSTTFRRCRAQLAGDAPKKRRLTSFQLVDGEQGSDAPAYGVTLIGPREANTPGEMCLFQLSFPADVASHETVDTFVDGVRRFGSLLPYVYGYGSPALQWAELGREAAIAESRGIATRHPGYDVNMNTTGRLWLGARVRGAKWLSFLGPEIAQKLGGVEALRMVLPDVVSVDRLEQGVMIRAGAVPEIGDKGSVATTPLLRSVAAVLEPVTAFEEVVLLGSFADWDKEELAKWERRFLN